MVAAVAADLGAHLVAAAVAAAPPPALEIGHAQTVATTALPQSESCLWGAAACLLRGLRRTVHSLLTGGVLESLLLHKTLDQLLLPKRNVWLLMMCMPVPWGGALWPQCTACLAMRTCWVWHRNSATAAKVKPAASMLLNPPSAKAPLPPRRSSCNRCGTPKPADAGGDGGGGYGGGGGELQILCGPFPGAELACNRCIMPDTSSASWLSSSADQRSGDAACPSTHDSSPPPVLQGMVAVEAVVAMAEVRPSTH